MSIHSLCKHPKKHRTKSWTMRIFAELSSFCRTKMHLVSSFIQQCGQRKCLLIHLCCKTNCGPCQQSKRSIFGRQELLNGLAQHPSNKLGTKAICCPTGVCSQRFVSFLCVTAELQLLQIGHQCLDERINISCNRS